MVPLKNASGNISLSTNFRTWLGESGTISSTRMVQSGPQMRAQPMTFRWHQEGIARRPESQKAQMFFSEVTGLYCSIEERISSLGLRSTGLVTSSSDWYSGGIAKCMTRVGIRGKQKQKRVFFFKQAFRGEDLCFQVCLTPLYFFASRAFLLFDTTYASITLRFVTFQLPSRESLC